MLSPLGKPVEEGRGEVESRVCRPRWPYSRHVLAAILQFPVDCLAAYLHLAHGGGVGDEVASGSGSHTYTLLPHTHTQTLMQSWPGLAT